MVRRVRSFGIKGLAVDLHESSTKAPDRCNGVSLADRSGREICLGGTAQGQPAMADTLFDRMVWSLRENGKKP